MSTDEALPHSNGSDILVATDESAEGRHAVRAACSVAHGGSNLTVLRVLPSRSAGESPAFGRESSHFQRPLHPADDAAGHGHPELGRLIDWIGSDFQRARPGRSEVAVSFGVPGIEIGRAAANRRAGLIVLGRRTRGRQQPLVLGETSDAVVRRSDRPVLFVPTTVGGFQRMLVAVDGTDRAAAVLDAALAFGRLYGASVSILTVEPGAEEEGLIARAATMPRARPVRIAETIRRVPAAAGLPVAVRQGNPIEEVLSHAEATNPDILVVGYRRGGPPKVVGPTEIARNLLHAAAMAVLTIPV